MRSTCELHPSLPLTFLCHHKATHLRANRIEDRNGRSGPFSDYHFLQWALAVLSALLNLGSKEDAKTTSPRTLGVLLTPPPQLLGSLCCLLTLSTVKCNLPSGRRGERQAAQLPQPDPLNR